MEPAPDTRPPKGKFYNTALSLYYLDCSRGGNIDVSFLKASSGELYFLPEKDSDGISIKVGKAKGRYYRLQELRDIVKFKGGLIPLSSAVDRTSTATTTFVHGNIRVSIVGSQDQ